MPLNKEAYLRYTIIDACLTDKFHPYPDMQYLIEKCEDKLGKEFHVSTIQKDIKAMKEDELLGYMAPIKFSKSHNGYYYSEPGFTIRKISLQESELDALKAALELLSMYQGSRVSENFNEAVNKVLASVHESQPDDNARNKIIQTDNSSFQKGFEHFEFFFKAAKEKTPVCFVHYSYRHRVFNSHIVHPLILKEFNNTWYIVGYSETHKSIRTFGLDRIYEPLLLKHTFIEPKEKVRDDYFKYMYGVYPMANQEVQEIEFIVPPFLSDYLNAHPIHDSQTKKKESVNGHAIFNLKLIPTIELLNFFFSFSYDLTIIKPGWIQEEMIKRHKHALRHEEAGRK